MRLIDADEAYKVLTDYYHHRTEIQHKALKEAIGKVPTIDAVGEAKMADRLISADTLRAAKYHALPYTHIHALGVDAYSYERGWNDALDAVADSAPTVDAVPVVRCKDCKHYSEDGWGYGNCYRPNVDYLRMNERGFCSWGERREDGAERE